MRWCANQIVDLLAKQSADECRVAGHDRRRLGHVEARLFELVQFLGKLTLEVNNHCGADGLKIRDSTASRRVAGRKRPSKRAHVKPVKVRVAKGPPCRAKAYTADDWIEAWHKSHGTKLSKPHEGVSRSTRIKRAGALLSSRQEAAFQEWWRESRSQTLQPRPASAPTAAQRLEALRSLISARSLHSGG